MKHDIVYLKVLFITDNHLFFKFKIISSDEY